MNKNLLPARVVAFEERIGRLRIRGPHTGAYYIVTLQGDNSLKFDKERPHDNFGKLIMSHDIQAVENLADEAELKQLIESIQQNLEFSIGGKIFAAKDCPVLA